jgi:hypothetical protein
MNIKIKRDFQLPSGLERVVELLHIWNILNTNIGPQTGYILRVVVNSVLVVKSKCPWELCIEFGHNRLN